MSTSPSTPVGNGRSAGALAALLASAGVAHFASPEFFDAIVPSWMPGSARITTHVSGLVEIAAAILLANPATRRRGGLFAMATFVGVFPANIWAALQGGMKGMDPPFDSAAVAWLRLPLQLPLIWWAWKIAQAHVPESAVQPESI